MSVGQEEDLNENVATERSGQGPKMTEAKTGVRASSKEISKKKASPSSPLVGRSRKIRSMSLDAFHLDPLSALADLATLQTKPEASPPRRAALGILPEEYAQVYNKKGRIGIYTPHERLKIIEKFKSKRERRIWKKHIRYDCRKNLADNRLRVKGRFVKQAEPSEEWEAA